MAQLLEQYENVKTLSGQRNVVRNGYLPEREVLPVAHWIKNMNRKLFLTIASTIAFLVGGLALMAPDVLLTSVKAAVSNPAALVMARTVGVLLLAMGFMGFLVRGHVDSPTMEAFLKTNLFLQLSLIPIDPLAYMNGTFTTLGSFVPNTIIHILLAVGFAHHLIKARKALAAQSPMANGK